MRVGFDGKRATMNFTGLGNYCRSVLIHLGKFFPENEFIIYTPGLKNSDRYPELTRGRPFFFRYPKIVLKKYFSWFWRSFLINGLLESEKIEIYHGLSGELPYGFKPKKTKFILTVHDLIFYRFPEFYRPLDRFIYKLKSLYASKKADQILAISEQTRLDILEFLKVDPKKVSVLYQSCSQGFYDKLGPIELNRIRNVYQLPTRYILYVGTLEPRKRSLDLLKAFKILNQDLKVSIELVLVGKKTPYFLNLESFIKENHLGQRVHTYHNVSMVDLPGFYQMAELFVYPSTFEGFGLPILEALVSGVPVITSLGSCFSEAGGEGSIYLDPQNTIPFAEKMKEILENAQMKELMKKNGYEHSRKFEARLLTNQLMEVYQNLLNE